MKQIDELYEEVCFLSSQHWKVNEEGDKTSYKKLDVREVDNDQKIQVEKEMEAKRIIAQWTDQVTCEKEEHLNSLDTSELTQDGEAQSPVLPRKTRNEWMNELILRSGISCNYFPFFLCDILFTSLHFRLWTSPWFWQRPYGELIMGSLCHTCLGMYRYDLSAEWFSPCWRVKWTVNSEWFFFF